MGPCGPRGRWRIANTESVVDPVDKRIGTAATKLAFEFVVFDRGVVAFGSFGDKRRATNLLWPYDLLVINEEHAHFGDAQQLINLGIPDQSSLAMNMSCCCPGCGVPHRG